MFALVTDQGTAASETALCAHHIRNPLARREARQAADKDVPWRGTGPYGSAAPFVDCTGNDALECIIGGCDE
jgi:hypothetical protein